MRGADGDDPLDRSFEWRIDREDTEAQAPGLFFRSGQREKPAAFF